jgi:hypothetical protein
LIERTRRDGRQQEAEAKAKEEAERGEVVGGVSVAGASAVVEAEGSAVEEVESSEAEEIETSVPKESEVQ